MRLQLFVMLFGVVSGVWGRTPPALFVLPLFEQISVLYDACMCVCCVHYSVSRQSRSGPFILWLTIKHGPCAHHSEYPLSTVPRTLLWWRATTHAQNKSGQCACFIATYRPRFLVFPFVCVFTSRWRSTLHSPFPWAPSPAPSLHLTLFSRSKILQKSSLRLYASG